MHNSGKEFCGSCWLGFCILHELYKLQHKGQFITKKVVKESAEIRFWKSGTQRWEKNRWGISFTCLPWFTGCQRKVYYEAYFENCRQFQGLQRTATPAALTINSLCCLSVAYKAVAKQQLINYLIIFSTRIITSWLLDKMFKNNYSLTIEILKELLLPLFTTDIFASSSMVFLIIVIVSLTVWFLLPITSSHDLFPHFWFVCDSTLLGSNS